MKRPEKNLNVPNYACHALTMLVINHTYFTHVLLRLVDAQNMSAGTRRRNDKALTSMRRHYVALTPLRYIDASMTSCVHWYHFTKMCL